jgi:hypothetical protein
MKIRLAAAFAAVPGTHAFALGPAGKQRDLELCIAPEKGQVRQS